MPTHSEATRLNLEYYRKQAKSLLKAVKSGDPDAAERLARHVTRFSQSNFAVVALHDAQLAIAREKGFASWPRFKEFLAQSTLDLQSLVTAFVDAALSDSRRAETMLADHPELAEAGLYPALVLGDVERVEHALRETPGLVGMQGGPREWEPLLYISFSRFARGGSRRAAALVTAARAMLRAGANPSASYNPEEWPENPALVGYTRPIVASVKATRPARMQRARTYSEPRKFRISCCCEDLSWRKTLITSLASDPLPA